jgi:S-disulfanyl-L-cysteine oxidoreductase SoxD
MERRILVAAAAMCVTAVVIAASSDQQSVWSGVYTDAQADQGAALYKTHCVTCHGDTLAGGEQVPALRGVSFGATWEGVPLSDLLERMRKTMPPGKSGVVTRQEYANILAFLVKMNGMPAGSVSLASDQSALASIIFRSNKP